MALILDTGPLYAALDRSDADHGACRTLIESTDKPLLIPSPVLAVVERLGEEKLATLDERHFRAVRPRHIESLRLLPVDS